MLFKFLQLIIIEMFLYCHLHRYIKYKKSDIALQNFNFFIILNNLFVLLRLALPNFLHWLFERQHVRQTVLG